MTLLERLEQINEESRAFMAKDPRNWAGMITTDLTHWAKYGVYTAEQLDYYLDKCKQKR